MFAIGHETGVVCAFARFLYGVFVRDGKQFQFLMIIPFQQAVQVEQFFTVDVVRICDRQRLRCNPGGLNGELFCLLFQRFQLFHFLEKDFSGCGQNHPVVTSPEQGHADLLLQQLHLLGQCGG